MPSSVLLEHYMQVVDKHLYRQNIYAHEVNSVFKDIENSISYISFVPSFRCTETEIDQCN